MWLDFANLLISILSLGATIAVSVIIYKLERKHEKRNREKEIKETAKKFIHDNLNEKEYILLATIASGCFSQYNHSRKIYEGFDLLDDETKLEVIKQVGLECQLIQDDEWIIEKIDLIKEAIGKLGIGNDFLYDDGKYFTKSFDYRERLISDFESMRHHRNLYDDAFGIRKKYIIIRKYDKLTYEEYLEDFLYSKYDEKNLPENVQLPNDYLIEMEKLKTCDEILLCYWLMVIVKNVINYAVRYLGYKKNNHSTISTSCCKSFEDYYFLVLYELYYLVKE